MEAERPQGAKGSQMHGIKREGEAGLVLTIPGNGTMAKKEREKDGGVMMVDVIYTVCRTWTLAPLAHLGEKKKEKRRRAPWGRVRTRNEKNNHHIYNNFISYFKKQNQNHSTQGFPRGPPPWY